MLTEIPDAAAGAADEDWDDGGEFEFELLLPHAATINATPKSAVAIPARNFILVRLNIILLLVNGLPDAVLWRVTNSDAIASRTFRLRHLTTLMPTSHRVSLESCDP